MKKLPLVICLAAVLSPVIASAHQAGDFLFRTGPITVRPNEGSENVLGLGSLSVNNNTQLGLTFGYMVTDNIGVELLAATPFKHKISVPGAQIADTQHLPPTLMAQWYFGGASDKLRPYLGVGLNYTTFFDEGFNSTGSAVGVRDLSLKDSWGVAAQAGLDYNINKNWMINASVWWMNIESEASMYTAADGQKHTFDVRLDPWVFMFGVGYRF